jgi:hypothetical protein
MESAINQNSHPAEVSDQELRKVIADFLEMGYVENIVAMFKQESRYYQWIGEILADERFAVRLGVSVLFEYLCAERPDDVELALPSLSRALEHEAAYVRGEAVGVLAIIGTQGALALVRLMVDDPASEVAGIARDVLDEAEE